MKISEMNTDRAADVMVNIVTPLTSIATDAEILKFLQGYPKLKGQPMLNVISSAVTKLVPVMLKTHRDDLYIIISEMTGKTVEEVKAQNIMETMSEVRDFVDKDFVSFFTSVNK